MIDPNQIETQYAKSGDLNIAYQLFGDGPINMVYVPGWTSNVEFMWTIPENHELLDKLASFARVVVLDRRGTGLSDPFDRPPTLEERMDDVRAVMDAVGWERAAVFGISEGGPMSMLFAASYPERTQALLLYGTFARFTRSDDFHHGYPPSANEEWLALVEPTWGTGALSRGFVPSKTNEPNYIKLMARFERMAMSPGTAAKHFRLLTQMDVRHVLPAIRVPTLVLHRTNDVPVRIEQGRYLAEHIPGAKFVELPGADHIPFMGDQNALLSEVREFLTGERAEVNVDRILTTILFCDIADSTKRAAEVGDHAWRNLLARFYAIADDKLRAHRGRKLDTAGDGLFAAFDGPARAVRCGQALCEALTALGVQLRVGVHTGECEVLGDKYSGIAVHLGARIASAAEPGQVVVSSTVKDLVVGSGLHFDDLGSRALKGVPDEWRLYRTIA